MRFECTLQAVKIPTFSTSLRTYSIAFRCISTTLSLPKLPVDHLQEPLRLKSLMSLRLIVVVAGFVGKLQSTCTHVVLAAVLPSVNPQTKLSAIKFVTLMPLYCYLMIFFEVFNAT